MMSDIEPGEVLSSDLLWVSLPAADYDALREENARLRQLLFSLLDMCDVQARNDGVLSVLREAMEEAREALKPPTNT